MNINFFRHAPKLLLVWLLIAIQACENDPTPEISLGSAGFFVVNEGGFNHSNTSISFYDREKNTITNDVFAANNDGRPLGDQSQSLTVWQGKAYIVVQHSAKIEVIDADSFKSLGTITGDIESPRYFIGISSTKGYVSDWGADGMSGGVRVIDLGTMMVTKTIETGKGANKMVLKDGKVYVANSGGFDYDNKISVIDVTKDEVSSTIPVGDNPNSLQFDKDGNLWVASAGTFAYNEDYSIDEAHSTKSTISKITNGTEAVRLPIEGFFYPGVAHLNINNAGDKLYYLFNGKVYAMPVSSAATPGSALIGDKYFYGLAIDPFNDKIVACEAPDFSSTGKVYYYSDDALGYFKYDVGIAPNGVGFK